jgi:glycosyltransferase involved in cell wall biosynthesis
MKATVTPVTRPKVSVVVSTYNRAYALPNAIDSLLRQDFDPERFELVIVDNNSTDGTCEVVEAIQRRAPQLHYVFEPRRGASYGRNAGILAARASIIAFTDDDIRVSTNWLSTVVAALAQHPEVACVGGRVLPTWAGTWPAWLTREHWAPLALLDYGEAPIYVTAQRRLCLITANVAYRREVFDRIGMFSPHVQTLGRAVGTEDHELLLRLWRAGGQGLYWPTLLATADIDPERMRPAYHRRWHLRHGRALALMHDDEIEQTNVGRFLGVPAHIYRAAITAFVEWIRALFRGDAGTAFRHEFGLWSCLGFIRARWPDFVRGSVRREP